MSKLPDMDRRQQIEKQVQQLILLRETGPKSARWHAARARLIWRLQDALTRAEQLERGSGGVAEVAEEPDPDV
ncbi:MAG TPA: hypothetical protein VF897_05795 [Roseiflexaceae bacterium]